MNKISRRKESNEDIRVKNKNEVRMIEQAYVDNELNGLDNAVKIKREEIEEKLVQYLNDNKIKKYNKDGNSYEVPNVNPLVIHKYFFQSICPLVNVEPLYNAEKLGIVWQLYSEMIGKINAKIGIIVPNLSNFCEFAGIRTSTFRRYKNSADESMRIVVEKIEDGCYDVNVTMAQMGYLKERTTVYRMKSEQEKIEKQTPTIHIHNDVEVDLDKINSRIKEIQGKKAFCEKKRQVVEIVEVIDNDNTEAIKK